MKFDMVNKLNSKDNLKIPALQINSKRAVSFVGSETDGEKTDQPPLYDHRSSLLEDDSSSVLSIPAELPPPPDGGWGWMVVMASFLANMIVDGISYSFSPYLDVYSDHFDEPKGTIAWVPSLLAGVYLSVGPIVSSLSNKFGCRRVCISGGIVAALAYASTLFAKRIEFLMITQGLIAGFGFGLIYLPAVVAVGYYFESKRALATGIAVCGSGVGTMIFPPIMNRLIQEYGWKGSNLIIAGLILNCCWFGGLMRPLKVPKMRKKDLLHRLAEDRKTAMEMGSLFGSNYITMTNPDGTVEKRPHPAKMLNPDPGVHSHLNLTGYSTPRGTSFALPTIEEGAPPPDDKSQSQSRDPSPLSDPVAKDEERQSLVAPQQAEKTSVPEGASRGRSSIPSEKMTRNRSQPSMEEPDSQMPKNKSVPNFERRLSKLDIVGQLKLIPATPEASYTNLRSLTNSQDLRRLSGGEHKNMSYLDAEGGATRQRRNSKEVQDTVIKVMSRQDIFYSGSIRRLDEFKSQPSFLSYRESTVNIHGLGASKAVLDAIDGILDIPEEKKKKCCPDFTGTFGQMMDFSLMKNPVFLLIGIANLLGMLGFYTPFVYLPSAAMAKGIDKGSATFLVSIIGITNTIGRVLSGLLADLPRVNPLWVNNLCITFSAVCVFLTPFATTYSAFVCISIFFGFFVSGYISLSSIILVELLGLENLTNAFGLLILFRGSASLVGAPIAGSIYDATQSYDVSFWSAGLLLFACAFLHCIVPCVQRWCPCYDGPVRYTTNEEYMKKSGERDGNVSPDAGEGAGIVFEIKPKRGSYVSYASSEKVEEKGAAQV